MPLIFEKDIDKYYDKEELNLIKRGSGLFPAGHYPRKERSGNGLSDLITQGVRIFKTISENKENIKNVAEAVGSVVTAGKKIKDTVTNDGQKESTIQQIAQLVPSADSIDPSVYAKLRESMKTGDQELRVKVSVA